MEAAISKLMLYGECFILPVPYFCSLVSKVFQRLRHENISVLVLIISELLILACLEACGAYATL
jgi:hypothetical protein